MRHDARKEQEEALLLCRLASRPEAESSQYLPHGSYQAERQVRQIAQELNSNLARTRFAALSPGILEFLDQV